MVQNNRNLPLDWDTESATKQKKMNFASNHFLNSTSVGCEKMLFQRSAQATDTGTNNKVPHAQQPTKPFGPQCIQTQCFPGICCTYTQVAITLGLEIQFFPTKPF